MKSSKRTRRFVAGGALVLAGFGAGAAIATTGSASAATDAVSGTRGMGTHSIDPTNCVRPDEHLLTGTTASKVKAAALAKYPKATILRLKTDADGVYEAHIVTADDKRLIVQVGKDFTVTGTDTAGGPGRGGHGPGPAPSNS